MCGFTACELLPGVFHICDRLGVYMTLLTGETGALLVDAGYGLDDVKTYVRTLTPFEPRVLLTHAHHDHALGAMWFNETEIFPQDLDAWDVYTGRRQRECIAEQAKGMTPPHYLTAPIPRPKPAQEGAVDLGGMTAQILLCPGHTPGSAVVYVPQRKLLLTGDDWNPCTWLFFPEALPVQDYLENVRALLKLPFEYVLCPHRAALYPRSDMERFLDGLTEDALRHAAHAEMGFATDTREVLPAPGMNFVFDYEKAGLKEA